MKIGTVASLIVALVGVVLCHKKTVKSRDDEIEVKKNDDKVCFSFSALLFENVFTFFKW